MRGKPSTLARLISQARNIPAYAGKTQASSPRRWKNPEHPRVCGENVARPDALGYIKGTSPRMRGKRQVIAQKFNCVRNIPAYAGKTPSHSTKVQLCQEHPRVCGENPYHRMIWTVDDGTSPRMRGKPRIRGQSAHKARNIPAYAGKTNLSLISHYSWAEHPRVCGENPT